MTQVHPDVHESFREAYPYTAQEINTAYALLEKETPVFQNADASGYHKTAHSFCSIDLWVKLIPKGLKEMPENLNLQIQQLLASIKT